MSLRTGLKITNLLAAAIVTGGLGYVGFRGAGPLPPLGAAFNPGTGVWTTDRTAQLPHTESISVPGVIQPVKISFDKNGSAYIQAQANHDLFYAMGYIHAKYRLFQMDLMRRQGEGGLSAVVGKAALPSDEFELQLGLQRTAETEWTSMSNQDPERAALNAYADGVNALIRQDEASGNLPMLFKLLGYKPAAWSPVDSLVIQGDMTQTLDFTTAPLDYALLVKSLGYDTTMQIYPVLAANAQHPYDLGPYPNLPPAPIESQLLTQTPETGVKQAPMRTVSDNGSDASVQSISSSPTDPLVGNALTLASWSTPSRSTPSSTPPSWTAPSSLWSIGTSSYGDSLVTGTVAQAAGKLLGEIHALPKTAIHTTSNSNNWAVDGSKTANGQTMLAGDPHLNQTIPSIWYQLAGQSPSFDFQGVSIPGLPGILIGHNQHIAWSLTNVQNQATLFYSEKTDLAHPNQYYWNGKWMPMNIVHYSIAVKGEKPVPLDVKLTVHGPIMTENGETMAVDWMGALPSPDLDSMMGIMQASTFNQFKEALKDWHAPSQNFVYADDAGNIGLISAGYYPIVKSGKPWLPLSGTGESDVVGTVPYEAVPQVYDPPSHFVFSANQREVGTDYPYYIGTSMDFFSNGYRADEIYDTLSSGSKMTMSDFAKLQNDNTDYLAKQLVPALLQALQGESLTDEEQAAVNTLTSWNDSMDVNSPAASIWWTFLSKYLDNTFSPWWVADKVPVAQDSNLEIGPGQDALVEDLQAWTLSDKTNKMFSLPDGTHRSADDVMRLSFQDAVASLSKQFGSDVSGWTWGKLHAREFPALSQTAGLGYGPRPSGGDSWTVDAADGGMVSTAGPSWRMIVNFGTGAEGTYPGGQSENPVSPWYENRVDQWWNGQYSTMLTPDEASSAAGSVVWTLQRGGGQ